MQAHETLAFFIITKAKKFSSTFFRKVCLPSASCDSVLSAYASIFLRKTARAARNSPLRFGMAAPRRPPSRVVFAPLSSVPTFLQSDTHSDAILKMNFIPKGIVIAGVGFLTNHISYKSSLPFFVIIVF